MSYRILALDGGGSWALIELKALIAIYGPNQTGHAVLQDFDLVAANSGGSIVLGGLVENLTLAQILGMFQDQTMRQSIFSPTHSVGDKVLEGLLHLGPKYSAENKLPALENAFPATGSVPLGQVVAGLAHPPHLLITAFDYDANRAVFFRSAPASGPAWGTGESADVTLAEAIHASTNAPVNYFDQPATFPDQPGRYFWDGAIAGCNNPVLAAVTEAIVLGNNATDFAVLSIGTASVVLPDAPPGQPPSPLFRPAPDPGFVNDLHKLAASILDDPPDIATFIAHVMTRGGAGVNQPAVSRVVRMNPLISPVNHNGVWSPPGSMTLAQFKYLANLDMDAIQQAQVNAISSYADLWVQGVAPINQPIRMNTSTLAPELGPVTFAAALAAWNAIR